MREGSEQQARQYYDDFSRSYERERGHGYHQMIDDLELQVTAPYARGARVLELGCGTGLILAQVAEIADTGGRDRPVRRNGATRTRTRPRRAASEASATSRSTMTNSTSPTASKCLRTSRTSTPPFERPHASRGPVGICCWSSTTRGAFAISPRRSPDLSRARRSALPASVLRGLLGRGVAQVVTVLSGTCVAPLFPTQARVAHGVEALVDLACVFTPLEAGLSAPSQVLRMDDKIVGVDPLFGLVNLGAVRTRLRMRLIPPRLDASVYLGSA